MNSQIKARVVRLIGEDGKQIGIVARDEALRLAVEKGLDLVEVSPQSKPPVCRILDYGKYRYEQSKRAKEAKKHQHTITIKEIKMRPVIEDHDYEFKLNHIRRFLEHGDRVRVVMTYRGREITHQELGTRIMERVLRDTEDVGKAEHELKQEGRNMVVTLVPKKAATSVSQQKKRAERR